jgi:hypothetical protein
MKKFLLIAGSSLLMLVVVAAIAGRMILKTYIESDEFREQLARTLTRASRGFISKSIVDVSALKVMGLMSIESDAINIRSADKSENVVTITSAKISPKILSILTLGPILFEAELFMQPTGSIRISGKIPLSLLSRKKTDESAVEVSGEVISVNAVELTDLMQTAQRDPYFRLSEGTLNGRFQYTKPLGKAEATGEKSGYLNLNLTAAKWTIPSKKEIVPIETLPVELRLKDFVISIEKPIVLKDESGTATLSGAVNLPKQAEEEKSWDIKADVVGSSGLLLVVTNLFKCPSPPAAYSFKVTGEFSNSRCVGL